MFKINRVSFAFFMCFIILQSSITECRPHHSQKVTIHGHEWIVPNEPGWEDILQEAESHRRKALANCASALECRLAAERLREIFLKHPVSAKYYDDSISNDYRPSSDMDSIFRWG